MDTVFEHLFEAYSLIKSDDINLPRPLEIKSDLRQGVDGFGSKILTPNPSGWIAGGALISQLKVRCESVGPRDNETADEVAGAWNERLAHFFNSRKESLTVSLPSGIFPQAEALGTHAQSALLNGKISTLESLGKNCLVMGNTNGSCIIVQSVNEREFRPVAYHVLPRTVRSDAISALSIVDLTPRSYTQPSNGLRFSGRHDRENVIAIVVGYKSGALAVFLFSHFELEQSQRMRQKPTARGSSSLLNFTEDPSVESVSKNATMMENCLATAQIPIIELHPHFYSANVGNAQKIERICPLWVEHTSPVSTAFSLAVEVELKGKYQSSELLFTHSFDAEDARKPSPCDRRLRGMLEDSRIVAMMRPLKKCNVEDANFKQVKPNVEILSHDEQIVTSSVRFGYVGLFNRRWARLSFVNSKSQRWRIEPSLIYLEEAWPPLTPAHDTVDAPNCGLHPSSLVVTDAPKIPKDDSVRHHFGILHEHPNQQGQDHLSILWIDARGTGLCIFLTTIPMLGSAKSASSVDVTSTHHRLLAIHQIMPKSIKPGLKSNERRHHEVRKWCRERRICVIVR